MSPSLVSFRTTPYVLPSSYLRHHYLGFHIHITLFHSYISFPFTLILLLPFNYSTFANCCALIGWLTIHCVNLTHLKRLQTETLSTSASCLPRFAIVLHHLSSVILPTLWCSFSEHLRRHWSYGPWTSISSEEFSVTLSHLGHRHAYLSLFSLPLLTTFIVLLARTT